MKKEEAKAYTSLAMERCGLPFSQIISVLNEMEYLYNDCTGTEAISNASKTLDFAEHNR